MLKNIESKYFIKLKLFSYIEDKRKLKLIKYNKYLQNKIDINIFNYRQFTGKFIIYESYGKGKEYLNDKLIFEGEYVDGERNGIGKEYYIDGPVKYEGEYLNGERNGIGKEYDGFGKLKFEGEYLNGRELKGILYDLKNGNILYEINHIKGIGKQYDSYGYLKDNQYNSYVKLLYEGEYLNGKKHGKGKECHDRGIKIFEGNYLKGKRAIGKRNEDIDGEYIEDIDENMDEKFMKHREMLIKGSKRKNKRILFAENDNEF